MTIEIIYYWSQIIAVVAIVATLIAILVQAHQTNTIARAELTLNMWLQLGAMHYSLFDSPEKAEFMHRAMFGTAPLSEAEGSRLGSAFGIAIGTHEAAFNLRKRNLVELAAYNRSEVVTRLYLQGPRFRKWWRVSRDRGLDADFRALVDRMLDEVETGERQRTGQQGKPA